MFNEASGDQQIKDLQDMFQQLMHTYDVCMQRTLRKYNLYPGQPQLLLCIRTLDAPTQNRIAEEMGLSRASVGVSLRRLEQAGFVKRVRDKKDTRCIRIALTQKGGEYAHWCELDFAMIFSTMMENFRNDEREQTLAMLRTMEQNLQAYNQRMER